MQERLVHIDSLIRAGSYERARAEAMKLLSKEPRNAAVLNALAVVHTHLGELTKALYYGELATRHAANDPIVWRTYANLLGQTGKLDQAAAAFDRILLLAPTDAGSWLGRASIERMRENLDGAVELLKRGIAAAGEHEVLLESLVAGLNNAGEPEQAMKLCVQACEKYPDSLSLAALACNTSHNVVQLSRNEVFAVHRQYGHVMARRFPPPQVKYRNTPEPSRKLRVGIVSSDLRRHSVAFFIEPLLRCVDRTQVEITVYSTTRDSDALTERLKPLTAVWHDVPYFSDAQLAATIYADQVDVLIDLHGHTQGHRLGVFHNKPAPVQMTYLGYPDTTGLAAIDYRIVDSETDPPGAESLHTERLLRIDPCFLCYTPPPASECPSISSVPQRPLTFGCFNALHKLSDYSIGLWAKVLGAVPGSHMIIKCPVGSQSLVSSRVVHRFVARGVDTSRITVLPVQKSLREHLQAYEQMDIALDAFPYHGTTTTCEALFMGVPVVTLAGDMHVRRVGASILSVAGCAEWVAKTEGEYIATAANLAQARPSRELLRAQVLASPLCDGPAFAQRMSAAIRSAWTVWCQGNVS